jgi:C-terminal processing protease CtpA/Prc
VARPGPAKEEAVVVEKVEEKKVEATQVEIKRDEAGLGLSIVGGSDTPLVSRDGGAWASLSPRQGGIFIHEIHAGGAAEKAGQLHQGDLVTKVNDVDFKTITHKEALAALRATDKVILKFKPLRTLD